MAETKLRFLSEVLLFRNFELVRIIPNQERVELPAFQSGPNMPARPMMQSAAPNAPTKRGRKKAVAEADAEAEAPASSVDFLNGDGW